MCGICGKLRFDDQVVDRALIGKMCDTIAHRGPDAEGIHVEPRVGLGQRRLAIIDLSDAAVAPLPNEDETVWVTLNGEIYNYRELRAELCARGHRFRTATDTEVLVHLYEEYGTDCLTRLRGMFAFALWDSRAQRLFAARDRLGKKPFVYCRTSRGLTFGSAIRAVTADPDVSVAPDLVAIDRYLTYQFVPSPLTAFEGIEKLPPGHYLVCDAKGTLTVEEYWKPPAVAKLTGTEDEIANELLDRVREAVRVRLVSDVPIGAFLSGGVDSSSVVALMAEASSRAVKTFSIGFEETGFDESADARLVAERYETDHHQLVVRPDALAVLPELVRQYNEPFADSSAIPTYYVSKLTRDYVTVALSGDGADESFAGYAHHEALLRWEAVDAIPGGLRRAAARLAEATLGMLPNGNTVARLQRGAQMLGKDLPARQHQQLSGLKEQEKRALYTPQFCAAIAARPVPDRGVSQPWNPAMDPLDWMLRHDQSVLLPEDFAVKVDVASMANALEVRSPFMDHHLMEYAAAIPSSMKRRGGEGKLILKRAMRRHLPERTLSKPKSGFAIPLARWLRADLRDLLHGMLLDDRAAKRGLLDRRFVRKMIDDHMFERRDWSNRLWALLFLELWFREFVD